MKRSIGLWQFFGFAFSVFGGTLLHFLYDLLGNAIWVAPFSAVNESTWEHMKLLFFPTFIYAIFESFFFREKENFLCIKKRGILLGIFLIPIIFYTYNGVIGKSPDWVNITIFFVCAAIEYVYETRLFQKGTPCCKKDRGSIILLCVVAILFVLFTFVTPEINIFKDPISGTYGI